MKLDFFKEQKNGLEEKEVKNFVKELTNYIEEFTERISDKIVEDLNNFREEECLYFVIEKTNDEVYLQNLNLDIVFKETNLEKEIKDVIGTDYILRYKNGQYFIEDELTEKFLNSMVGINEYNKIQKEFIKESKIEKNSKDTKYRVLNCEEKYSTLYFNNKENVIKVPNILLPYNITKEKVFYYENGKFRTDLEETRKNYKNSVTISKKLST